MPVAVARIQRNNAQTGKHPVSETEAAGLKTVKLLSGLPDEELESLAKACVWKRYAPHEQIIDRHSEARDIFFIVEGSARVANFSLSGREITLDDLKQGAHFGELAAIDGYPRSASVVALSNSYLAMLSPDRFTKLCGDYPEVAIQVMRSLASIVRSATDRIMDLSTLAANNRVHADLLRLARANLDDDNDNQANISPIPVHGDVASRVSTTRETVARVMNDLARQGVVKREKNKLVVLNVEALEDMVEEVKGE